MCQLLSMIAEEITPDHVAAWEAGQAGSRFGFYIDFSIRVGPEVGHEEDSEEKPFVIAECPGEGGKEGLIKRLAESLASRG